MTTTPITPAALTPQREAEILAARYTARSLASADIDIDDLLAEIDRLRAERHSTNDALAELTVAHRAEREAAEAEIASAQNQWEHWAKEAERLREELAARDEDVAFLHRNTLPELLRKIGHHKAGKQRWRERATKAEARVAELEAAALRAGQLAEQRHAFLDLDPDSACRPAGFVCPAAHTAPELEATR